MGQQSNSNRNASLNDKKKRAAGRRGRTGQNAPGRTAIRDADIASPTHSQTPNSQMTQVNRAVTASGNMNKHRGDRRDMNKTYTGNERHAARGNTPRKNVATRKA